jgi:hypothetical protein
MIGGHRERTLAAARIIISPDARLSWIPFSWRGLFSISLEYFVHIPGRNQKSVVIGGKDQ